MGLLHVGRGPAVPRGRHVRLALMCLQERGWGGPSRCKGALGGMDGMASSGDAWFSTAKAACGLTRPVAGFGSQRLLPDCVTLSKSLESDLTSASGGGGGGQEMPTHNQFIVCISPTISKRSLAYTRHTVSASGSGGI